MSRASPIGGKPRTKPLLERQREAANAKGLRHSRRSYTRSGPCRRRLPVDRPQPPALSSRQDHLPLSRSPSGEYTDNSLAKVGDHAKSLDRALFEVGFRFVVIRAVSVSVVEDVAKPRRIPPLIAQVLSARKKIEHHFNLI